MLFSNMEESWKPYAKKPVMKGHVVDESIDMKCPGKV